MGGMKSQNRIFQSFASLLVLAASVLVVPAVSNAQPISKTASAGPYSVTLKVLPAESFTGPKAAMTRDAGAKPELLNGPAHPNHHMVVFLKRNGKPVEKARVRILYRKRSAHAGAWMTLPVVRMHVTGHGLATTHFGNNVRLGPGAYQVRVTVNGRGPANFRFSLEH